MRAAQRLIGTRLAQQHAKPMMSSNDRAVAAAVLLAGARAAVPRRGRIKGRDLIKIVSGSKVARGRDASSTAQLLAEKTRSELWIHQLQ